MPIETPNLDDLSWDELLTEGRSLISSYAPGWTNHNPSDPGITLVELLAHMTEVLMFRVNQTTTNRQAFLTLIHGPHPQIARQNIHGELRKAIIGLHEIRRAVTPADFEHLALRTSPSGAERAARAKCIPRRNLEAENPLKDADAPGHLSVVLLSNHGTQPGAALLRAVKRTLEPARLLTTRIHTVAATFVTIFLHITLVAQPNVDEERLRTEAIHAVEDFYHPLRGGGSGKGWPFGQCVFVSELYQLLQTLDGIAYARRSRRPGTDDEVDELTVTPEESKRLITSKGELEAIRVEPYELVDLRVTAADIAIANR